MSVGVTIHATVANQENKKATKPKKSKEKKRKHQKDTDTAGRYRSLESRSLIQTFTSDDSKKKKRKNVGSPDGSGVSAKYPYTAKKDSAHSHRGLMQMHEDASRPPG